MTHSLNIIHHFFRLLSNIHKKKIKITCSAVFYHIYHNFVYTMYPCFI